MNAAQLKQYEISRKILLLMREGYPQRQAAAIAIRMWNDGELKLASPAADKQALDKRKREWKRERMRGNK